MEGLALSHMKTMILVVLKLFPALDNRGVLVSAVFRQDSIVIIKSGHFPLCIFFGNAKNDCLFLHRKSHHHAIYAWRSPERSQVVHHHQRCQYFQNLICIGTTGRNASEESCWAISVPRKGQIHPDLALSTFFLDRGSHGDT